MLLHVLALANTHYRPAWSAESTDTTAHQDDGFNLSIMDSFHSKGRRDDNAANAEDDSYAYGYGNAPGSFSGSGSGPGCLTNEDAYLGNGCCAGTCGESHTNCFDCPTTQEQDPVNYGGPSCFRDGSCIAEEPSGVCAAAGRQRSRGTGTVYAGWCACPEGSFCSGGGCNMTTPRQLWNPDEVSMHLTLAC